MVESILSGIYVWSLLGLLNPKSSVRQRRVMLDLIYVNVIIVTFDILVVILVYLNQVGISHPMQTFSYALKLKLEFVVLNQLMAVAARGLKREPFEERRYHHSSAHDAFSAECRRWDEKAPTGPPKDHSDSNPDASRKDSSVDSQLTMPEPVPASGNQSPGPSTTDNVLCDRGNRNEKFTGAEQGLRLGGYLEDDSASSEAGEMERIRTHPRQGFSGETLQPSKSSTPGGSSWHTHPLRLRDAKNKALGSMRHPLGRDESQDPVDKGQPMRATIKKHMPKRGGNSHDEDEEEEIGVHMWENNGKVKMETPWFKCKVEA